MTREIQALLKCDAEMAERVLVRMRENGIDFSRCSAKAFKNAAHKAHLELRCAEVKKF